MIDLATIRTLSVVVNGTIFIKMTYYLRLVEQFSYLIDIIFKIFDEIKSFMIVLLLISFLCSLSFYQIGQNQLQINLDRFKKQANEVDENYVWPTILVDEIKSSKFKQFDIPY